MVSLENSGHLLKVDLDLTDPLHDIDAGDYYVLQPDPSGLRVLLPGWDTVGEV